MKKQYDLIHAMVTHPIGYFVDGILDGAEMTVWSVISGPLQGIQKTESSAWIIV